LDVYVLSLVGLGYYSSFGHTGLVQEFDPNTYEKIGPPIAVGVVTDF